MSDSREQSPDWMHSFKVPTHSTFSLSSDSDLSQDNSPLSEDKDDDKLSLRAFLKQPKSNKNRAGISGEAGSSEKVSNEKSPTTKKQEEKVFIRKKKLDDETKGKMSTLPRQDIKIKNYSVILDQVNFNLSSNIQHAVKQEVQRDTNGEAAVKQDPNQLIYTLSSDSEPPLDPDTKQECCEHTAESSELKTSHSQRLGKGKDTPTVDGGGQSPSTKISKGKVAKKLSKVDRLQEMEEKADDLEKKGRGKDIAVAEEETSAKHKEPHVSSSRLPLVLSEKVHLSKALIECEGDSIDLSGDVGAVGRVVISDTPSGDHEMYLDLKGTIYKTTIVPSRTFCIVSLGPSEAKIEAIMNDFIQLNPQSNFNEAETMVEGTMEGFSFDSDEEADLMPKAIPQEGDQNDGTEKKTKGRSKRKAEQTSELPRKKGKTGGSKAQQSKRVKKKTQGSKKAATKR